MKPFATLGSEISKVRERVRRGAESLRPAKVALDVREQRDRLLAKLGEQTFRLIAERKLVVPRVLQESVEKLASLLGVQLPAIASQPAPATPAAVRASESFDDPADADEPSVGDHMEAAPPSRESPRPPRAAQKSAAPRKKEGGKRRKKR